MGRKEALFMNRLKHRYPELILNRAIRGGSSRKRPDGLLRYPRFAIVIEIDEHRHSYYNPNDESQRLVDIYNDLKHIPTVFVRFNPDKYYIDGVCFYGCFTKRYTRDDEVNYRYDRLCYYIDKYISHPPTQGIAVKKLFYSKQRPIVRSTDIDLDLLRQLDDISAAHNL